jgi:hypothetical protein
VRDLDEGGDSSPGLGSEEIGDVGQQRGHPVPPLASLIDMEIASSGQPSQTTRADSPEVVHERGEFDDAQEGKLSSLTSSLKSNKRRANPAE